MTTTTLTYADCSLEIVTNERGVVKKKTFSPVACAHDETYNDLVHVTDSNGKTHSIDHKHVDSGTYATPAALYDFINTSVKACLAA